MFDRLNVTSTFDIQIELGSTATDYEPYQGETYTTSLGQTVYGGALDVVSGEWVVDMAMVDLGDLNWTKYDTPQGTLFRCGRIADASTVFNSTNFICSNYATARSTARTNGTISCAVNKSVDVIDNNFSDATSFKTAMSGVQLCYELAEPQTYQLTPQQIDLLLGTNNVWSDGEVEVTYSKPLGQGATKFDVEGVYQITYHTEDECGNETDAVRVVAVSNNRYRTVTYEDGTFIINEDILDQPSNIARHGEAKYIYEPMLEDGSNYAWTSEPNTLWHRTFAERNSIKRVEIGSHIQPISIAYWFFHFDYCKEMDMTNLDTSRCTDMSYAFAYVGYFVSAQDAVPYLDLSHFDTSEVTSMRYMFNHLVKTKVIDISSWEVASTVDTHMLFSYCESVKTIYASDEFEIPATLDYSFFNSCSRLVGGQGTAYNDQDYTKSESTYARIDNPPEAPGYFTAK